MEGERVDEDDDELYDQLEQAMAEASNFRREAFEESVRREKAATDAIQQAMAELAEAGNFRREAFEESVRCEKAETDAILAIRKAKATENAYNEELKRISEKIELALRREKTELEVKLDQRDEVIQELRSELESKNAAENAYKEEFKQVSEEIELALREKAKLEEKLDQRDEVIQELRSELESQNAAENAYKEEFKQISEEIELALREKAELEEKLDQRDEVIQELRGALESQNADSDETVKELEVKIISAVELLESYKKERDELQIERNALKVAEELRRKQAGSSSSNLAQLISEFSFAEIEEATRSFDTSLKIGEGEYGSIYKGLLRHTEVAIKMLHSHNLQGLSEYQQEVDLVSKLRHPNLVTLIGACPEASTLIYEYLPNGSLEDRLSCRDNSSPLSWQTRIRIAAELCSALIFLHSNRPHSIVHGDLKPANILLDANFVSKLCNFGICRVIFHDENSSINITVPCISDQNGSLAYIDPDFLAMGELTAKSDVYSFGIILLRLLTGRPALGIIKEVQDAIDNGDLKSLLDDSAGEWPYVQAQQLAHLALRCAELNPMNRPDLGSEVRRALEPMRASCGGASSTLRLGSEELSPAPAYFLCPIFQDVMEDPHVAVDGYTYEAEALRGWLHSGHDTSPMTNLTLEHTNLVPNLALRSAIREWQTRHREWQTRQ